MEKEISFKSRGDLCRGTLYTPDTGQGPFPVIVMAGGWCYVKEIVMPHYAEPFVQAGFAVINFDYRGFGESDGEPRQHINPYEQIEDYKNAITYAESLLEIDSSRIGIWGISYSGGHVLIVGATDPRVRCIVSTIPVIDGHENMMRAHGTMGFRRLMTTVMDDRRTRFSDENARGFLPHAALDPETLSVWPFPETYETFLEIQKTEAPGYDFMSTVESTELLMSYDVSPYLRRILNIPTLMLVAEGDDLVCWDLEVRAFQSIATAQKKLFVIPKTGHMALYSDKSKLRIAADVATDWQVEHLITPYR
ncbi:alpha/beta hydrolase [Pseudomonadota bacterium]